LQQNQQIQPTLNQPKIENKIIKKPRQKPNNKISNTTKGKQAKKSFKKKDNNLIINANDSSKRKIIPFSNNK
jgi:hypothetical protein